MQETIVKVKYIIFGKEEIQNINACKRLEVYEEVTFEVRPET